MELAFLQPPSESGGNWSLGMLTPLTGGRAISGPELVVHRFVLELCTVLSSMLFLEDRGSPLEFLLGGANALSERDLFDTFNVSISRMTPILVLEDATGDYPDDEKFQGASVNSIHVENGAATVEFTVLTASGQSAGLTIPFFLRT